MRIGAGVSTNVGADRLGAWRSQMGMSERSYRRIKSKDYTVGSKKMLAYEDPHGRILHFEQGVPVYFPGDRDPINNPVGKVKTS